MAIDREPGEEYAPGYPKDIQMPDGSIRRVHNTQEEIEANQERSEYNK